MAGQQNRQENNETNTRRHYNKRPNKDLTPSEKKAKRELKKQLKAQQKRIKLETRLRHAISRKDALVEEQTRQALKEMARAQQVNRNQCSNDNSGSNTDNNNSPTTRLVESGTAAERSFAVQDHVMASAQEPPLDIKVARTMITDLYHKLQQQFHSEHDESEKKEEQHRQALHLLKHMTKGTQERFMFDNVNALWGYTRQKFFERAMLVHSSFGKLHPMQQIKHIDASCHVAEEQVELRRLAWNKLKSVGSVCSVGCGPGNDVVGIVAFLQSLQQATQQKQQQQDGQAREEYTGCVLKRAILMDWAMAEWETIVNPLSNMLVPNHVETIETTLCDVTQSLVKSPANRSALERLLLVQGNGNNDNTQGQCNIDRGLQEQEHEKPTGEKSCCEVDLFLFSYILSEQRGLWESFLLDLVTLSKPGTMFYFAEPTPWQLHVFRKLFQQEMHFVWLDSSMNFPSLQPLENRAGPGVLLGMKKEKTDVEQKE